MKSTHSLPTLDFASLVSRKSARFSQVPFFFQFFCWIAGLWFFAALPGHAQEPIRRSPIALMKPPTEQEVFEMKVKHNPAFAQQLRVKSRVIAAKTKQPVAGAFIKFPVTDYTIHSDSLGNFSVLLPDSLAGQPLRVTVVHPEHGRVSITVTSDSFPAMIELPTAPRKMEVVE